MEGLTPQGKSRRFAIDGLKNGCLFAAGKLRDGRGKAGSFFYDAT